MKIISTVFFGLASLCLTLAANSTESSTKVWLIGGGNTLNSSQGQIEENVRWLQESLNASGIEVHTYFTHGGEDSHDVIYYASKEDRITEQETLSRVYGDGLSFVQLTKKNTLARVDGSTQKDKLLVDLERDFSTVSDGDHVVIVYNGHGDINPKDTRYNSLKLWGDTRLNIAELDQVLDRLPGKTQVSFVLTQCFSGSFTNLVYDNPFSDRLANQSRCGFLAESDRREAEGCDLGINQAEFRDYTTYFFAALFGKTRLGEALPRELIDQDNSGRISFAEAHRYTLATAYSGDLSRSSSEVMLEQAQPWYTRWDSWRRPPDNHYADIGRRVAEREALPERGMSLVFALFDKIKQKKSLEAEHDALLRTLKQQQQTLRQAVDTTPEQLGAMDQASKLQLARELAAHPQFPLLVQSQTALQSLNERVLQSHRALAQAEKILRMNRLARLSHWVESDDVAQVQACEENRYLTP